MRNLSLRFIVLVGVGLLLAAGGKATYDDLNLDRAHTGYKVGSNSGSLKEAGSKTFNITDFALDHFDISPSLTGTEIVNTPFPITITAKDSSENVVTDYSGTPRLSININYPFTNITPSNVTLTNGIWQGEVTITVAGYGIMIRASGDGKTGLSDAFNVLYPGPYSTISGQVLYNGNPFLTSSHVYLLLGTFGVDLPYPIPPNCYNPADGTFCIPNVCTGKYIINIRTDSDTPPNYHPFPGDFWGGSCEFTVAAPTPVTQNCTVCRIIHLKSPANNDPPGIPVPPPYPIYSSPITFAWDPIPEAATYNMFISRVQNDPYQHLESAYSGSGLTATEKTVSLPVNAPNQHYRFNVLAFNSSNQYVGELWVTWTRPGGGPGGFGGDYPFKVIAPLALDHFDISPSLTGTEIINTPFPITITAKDSSENVVTDYSGANTLSLNIYPYTNISPSSVTLTNGVWQGDATIADAEYGVRIKTNSNSKTGLSDAFNVLYPGPYSTISGQIMYNRSPFLTSSHVDFSLWDQRASRLYPIPPSCYNPSVGTFCIPNVRAGTYGIYIKTDSDTPPNFYLFPGNFLGGSLNFTVTTPIPTTQNFAVCRIIHLTSPANNNPPGIPMYPPYPVHPSPIKFVWDPIPEATTYNIEIEKVQDDPYQYLGLAYSESGFTATEKTVRLPANAPRQHYQFRVFALNRSMEIVGELCVTLTKPGGEIYGFGSPDYHFKVSRFRWIGPFRLRL